MLWNPASNVLNLYSLCENANKKEISPVSHRLSSLQTLLLIQFPPVVLVCMYTSKLSETIKFRHVSNGVFCCVDATKSSIISLFCVCVVQGGIKVSRMWPRFLDVCEAVGSKMCPERPQISFSLSSPSTESEAKPSVVSLQAGFSGAAVRKQKGKILCCLNSTVSGVFLCVCVRASNCSGTSSARL